jgi:hypothetical protein
VPERAHGYTLSRLSALEALEGLEGLEGLERLETRTLPLDGLAVSGTTVYARSASDPYSAPEVSLRSGTSGPVPLEYW